MRISHQEQLDAWVAGRSIHREFDLEIAGRTQPMDECCPDFSCCKPELQAEPAIRQAFAAAGERERRKFLGAFLSLMIANARELQGTKAQVMIAGQELPS